MGEKHGFSTNISWVLNIRNKMLTVPMILFSVLHNSCLKKIMHFLLFILKHYAVNFGSFQVIFTNQQGN